MVNKKGATAKGLHARAVVASTSAPVKANVLIDFVFV